MKKQFLFLVLLGLLCSVGNVWAYPTTIWESDMQESITGVTQTKGRGSDTWAENTGLSWASSSTYPKRFNAGGSSSALTFEFNESKSVNANTVIRGYWGATSNRTFSLFINNGESAVATQSSSPNSVVKTLEYEFTGDLSLSSFKIAVSGSSAYFFRVEIVDLGPKPTIGSTTISYALTANVNVVAGSTDNRMGTISNFSTSFAVSTLSITSGNSKDGYSGQITGHAADYSASQYVALSFDVASGYVFTPSSVGITIFANSTSNMKAKVELTDGVTSVTSNELSCASSADSDIEFADGAFNGGLRANVHTSNLPLKSQVPSQLLLPSIRLHMLLVLAQQGRHQLNRTNMKVKHSSSTMERQISLPRKGKSLRAGVMEQIPMQVEQYTRWVLKM